MAVEAEAVDADLRPGDDPTIGDGEQASHADRDGRADVRAGDIGTAAHYFSPFSSLPNAPMIEARTECMTIVKMGEPCAADRRQTSVRVPPAPPP